ncbi:MAG: hypothetical protein DI623_09665 [Sphingomonas sanxanigenens]|uniref:PilZ domain-containing protein n=1 Tax=Sphingomonas sanxanigenens TaxID=397260 RepID=A0A2W5A8S1_9SPHN|nr:MAG: hypothetical protein DI623_09665 [Sphingomonas sanxanigenens]
MLRRAKADRTVVEERRAHRYDVNIEASIEYETVAQPVRLVNLSRRGFGAAGEIAPPTDAVVTLTIPGVCHAKARIAWKDGNNFGAEFLAPQRLFLIPDVVGPGTEAEPSNDDFR